MQIRCCLQLRGAEASVACQAADCRVHCEQQRNKKPGRKLRNFLGETVGFHCQLLLFGFDQKQTSRERPQAYQTSLQVTPLESHFTISEPPAWILLLFVGSF